MEKICNKQEHDEETTDCGWCNELIEELALGD